MREPGLPHNLGIIPSVPIIKVTSSRTKLHLAATRALAAREDVASFGLSLPSPTTDLELQELMTWTCPRLTSLEIQQVLPCPNVFMLPSAPAMHACIPAPCSSQGLFRAGPASRKAYHEHRSSAKFWELKHR